MNSHMEIISIMNSIPAIVSAFPGGIYDFVTFPLAGLNRTNYPSAYDVDGTIKKFCIVKPRQAFVDNNLVNSAGYSYEQRVELWLYADRNYHGLQTEADIIFSNMNNINGNKVFLITIEEMYNVGKVEDNNFSSCYKIVLLVKGIT